MDCKVGSWFGGRSSWRRFLLRSRRIGLGDGDILASSASSGRRKASMLQAVRGGRPRLRWALALAAIAITVAAVTATQRVLRLRAVAESATWARAQMTLGTIAVRERRAAD